MLKNLKRRGFLSDSGSHGQHRTSAYPNCWMASLPVSKSAEMMPMAANLKFLESASLRVLFLLFLRHVHLPCFKKSKITIGFFPSSSSSSSSKKHPPTDPAVFHRVTWRIGRCSAPEVSAHRAGQTSTM